VEPPRAPPPPRGDVTMPEPPSSWAGSAHPPVKAALIGRSAAGRAGPVGGRTPSWPGLRLLPRRSGAPNRPGKGPAPRRGEPGPAPVPSVPGPAPGGGAPVLPPLTDCLAGAALSRAAPSCMPRARASPRFLLRARRVRGQDPAGSKHSFRI
jgi:hypothetical protein